MAKFDLSEHEDELLEALVKSAVGGTYTTKRVEQAGEDSPPIRHADTKEVPPDPEIAKYLLQILDRDKYATQEQRMRQQEVDIKKVERGAF